MLTKIKNSWALAKECWHVLMLDKEMVVYPLFSAFFNILVLGAAFLVMTAAGLISTDGEGPIDIPC